MTPVTTSKKRGKSAASENFPIDKDSTIKALQQADTYKFLGKEESIKQLNDIVISSSTEEFFQRLWIIWQSDLTLPNPETVDYLAVRFNSPKEIRSKQNICLTKIAIVYVDD